MTAESGTRLQKFKNLARFGAITYLIAWIILQSGLMFILFLSPNPPFLHKNIFGRKSMLDFVRIYTEAKLAGSNPKLVYDSTAQLITSQEILNTNEKIDCAENNAYTPHMCALLIPLTNLPLINAYWLWIGLSVLAGAIGMIAILKLERNFDNWSTAVTTLAILGSINSMTVLLAGQTTWFIFFFFCLLFIGLNRNKALLTGASFALSTIKPQYSFLFFAGLIGHRRWKELLCFAGITALMLVFAGYVLGWSNVISYPQILSQKSAGDEFWYPQKQCNLRAIFCYLMPYETAYKVGFACVFLAIPFVWKLWTGIKNNSDRLRWTFAITVLLALTFGPHVNPYDCVLVGLAAILTLPTVSPIEAWSLESQPLKWWTFMMLCYPSLGWVLGSNNYVFIPLNIGLTICGFLYLNSMEMQKEKPEAPAHEEPAKE